ncbi:MAG TPA: polysaccharide biosynthesis/export family protein [Chthoniobacteraceae bacterium]|jgi:polysaccharide export outer membrane protein|nr:polysaccharide biosynthesis/export family protein [Chthoniobacteraceae bacterium]
MKHITKWLLLSLLLALLIPARGQDTAEGAAASAQNYRLSPNDLVYIKVFQEDDLTSTLRIGQDGTIAFPLIGNVNVGGETADAAARTIRDLLDAKYLVNPQVSLTVIGYANRHITVLGQVQKPGDYNLREQDSVSLLQAIGLAGGFTRLANSSDIIVKRSADGEEKILHFNGKTMAQDTRTKPFTVMPGDIITVNERFL